MSSQPTPDNPNLGPLVLTVCWTLAGISTIIFTLRVLTRVKTKHGLRVNDYVMALSLVRLPHVHLKRTNYTKKSARFAALLT